MIICSSTTADWIRRLLATATDFKDWRIAPPTAPAAFFRGIPYFALDAVPGLRYQFDERTQELNIEGPPDILGVETTTALARDIGDRSAFTRLETTWTADDPERLSTLWLGDTIGRPGAWGRLVDFGRCAA